MAEEISKILHEYNNIFNTLNGYAELADEALKNKNREEYAFFQEKLLSTVQRKVKTAKQLSDRLRSIQTKIAEE